MNWTIDQETTHGIMLRGQSTVRVRAADGTPGVATVQYQPVCRVVGPVVEVVERDEWGLPVREAEVIDYTPTFAD